MIYTRDSDGHVRKAGKVRKANDPKTEHGRIMQDRSDDRLREMIRALDSRERKIVLDTLNEA